MGSSCTGKGTANGKGELTNRSHRASGEVRVVPGSRSLTVPILGTQEWGTYRSGDKFQDLSTEMSLKANLSPQAIGAGQLLRV